MKNVKIVPHQDYRVSKEIADRSKTTKVLNVKQSQARLEIDKFDGENYSLNFFVPIKHKGNTYKSVMPNPVHLFLNAAVLQFKESVRVLNEDFPKNSEYHDADKMHHLLSDSRDTNNHYTNYLQHKISSVILLVCSLEAFLNSQIPIDFIFDRTEKGRTKQYSCLDIQKFISLREKIDEIIPLIYPKFKRYYPSKDRDLLIGLIEMRNSLVHLNFLYQPLGDQKSPKLFDKLQKMNIPKYIDVVKIFMNYCKPLFIQEE